MRHSDLALAITRDAKTLVTGYAMAMSIAKIFGGVIAILIFKLTAPVVFHKPARLGPGEFLPFIVYPIILGAFMCFRAEETTACLEDVEKKEQDMMVYVD